MKPKIKIKKLKKKKKRKILKKKLKNSFGKKLIKKIKKTKKTGRWCTEVDGRLPHPIQCHFMRNLNNKCRVCTRKVNYRMWRGGAYNKIEDDIDALIDFTNPINIPIFIGVTDTAKKTLKKTLKKRKNK